MIKTVFRCELQIGLGALCVSVRVLRGLKFLSAPGRHPQNLNPPHTRRNLRNLARTRPALFPSQTCTSHC